VPPLKRLPLIFAVLLPNMVLDQWTKVLATEAFKGKPPRPYLGDTFRFTWATNEGAFLSLGSNLPDGARYWVLTVAVGGLLLGILYFAVMGKGLTAMPIAGYALIAAGGLSNWVDRVRFEGKVVDFMNLGIEGTVFRTGIFNIADLQILVGIALVLLAGNPEKDAAKAPAAAPPPPAAPGGSGVVPPP
jgi:signal peptidase II